MLLNMTSFENNLLNYMLDYTGYKQTDVFRQLHSCYGRSYAD